MNSLTYDVGTWLTYRTYRYQLIGVVHHSDKKIEQYDDVDDRVAAEHQQAPESSKSLNAHQFKVVKVNQTKSSPEQCLRCLEQTWKENKGL